MAKEQPLETDRDQWNLLPGPEMTNNNKTRKNIQFFLEWKFVECKITLYGIAQFYLAFSVLGIVNDPLTLGKQNRQKMWDNKQTYTLSTIFCL
jgi:hypothetical protein